MSIWRLGVLFEYHVLVSCQFCFKNGKSTVLAVESVLEQNLNYFESRQSMILCDLWQTRMYIVDCKPYDTHTWNTGLWQQFTRFKFACFNTNTWYIAKPYYIVQCWLDRRVEFECFRPKRERVFWKRKTVFHLDWYNTWLFTRLLHTLHVEWKPFLSSQNLLNIRFASVNSLLL